MKQLEKIKKMFNTDKKGDTHCFSLVCWTDGLWSVDVTDDWHKWLYNDIPKLDWKFKTPQIAVEEFLKHLKKHKIDSKKLQSKD